MFIIQIYAICLSYISNRERCITYTNLTFILVLMQYFAYLQYSQDFHKLEQYCLISLVDQEQLPKIVIEKNPISVSTHKYITQALFSY